MMADLSMTLSVISVCDNTREPAMYGDFELRTPRELADEALELLDKELPLGALGTFAYQMKHCLGYKEEMAAKYPRPKVAH